MYCRNCGEPMNDNQAICLKCGVKTNVGKDFCPNCGNRVDPKSSVCLNCGVALSGAFGDLAGKDKMVIALVCFFLGGLGIHNFMMGEKKKGIMKIILCFACGASGILALIDLVKILMDKYEVNTESLF